MDSLLAREEANFQMNRREEQRSNSRGRRVSKLDRLEMLLQRGG